MATRKAPARGGRTTPAKRQTAIDAKVTAINGSAVDLDDEFYADEVLVPVKLFGRIWHLSGGPNVLALMSEADDSDELTSTEQVEIIRDGLARWVAEGEREKFKVALLEAEHLSWERLGAIGRRFAELCGDRPTTSS